jgi:hypothetical protein
MVIQEEKLRRKLFQTSHAIKEVVYQQTFLGQIDDMPIYERDSRV